LSEEIQRDSPVNKVLALDDLHVAEDSATDPLMHSAFVEREGIASSVGVPLIARQSKVGVMFVNYRRHHRFTEDELMNIRLFANQAAVAIRNAQLYSEAEERAGALGALYEAAMVVTASLESKEILRRIARQAYKLASYRGTEVKVVHIRTIEGSKAKLAAAYPESEFTKKRNAGSLEIDVVNGVNGGIGIMGRAVKTGEPQVVGDVLSDPDFIECNSETHSELVVLLKRGPDTIGLINVEHSDYNAFDAEDRRVLEALAAQASIAIQNAEMNEELEKAYRELKELDGRKTEFLSTVSHELRSPLTTVRGVIEGLSDGSYGPLNNTKQLERLRIALESVGAEERLIRNLLNLDCIQAGKERLDLEQADVSDIISGVTRAFEYDADKKNISLITEVAPKHQLVAVIDAGKVREVITNLLCNAIKFTTPGGKINVSATKLDGEIEIRVGDTGPGIAKEEHLKVFDWFYQVDSSLTRKVGGAGIGLNVVKNYVEMHGGRVWVESEPGNGSVFKFTLPIRR
jgi:signal transduction histidine kinase